MKRAISIPKARVRVGMNKLSGKNHASKIVGSKGRKVTGARKGDTLNNSRRVK